MKQYGIRQYVAWLTLIPLIVIAVCLELFFLHNHFVELDRHIAERGKLIASQLESSSEYGVVSNNLPFLQGIAHAVSQQEDVRGLVILSSASSILVESGDFSSTARNALADTKWTMPDNRLAAIRYSGRSLLIYQPIIPQTVKLDEFETVAAAKPVGAVILEISLERTEKLKSKILWYTIAATVIFLVLVGLIVSLASRHITIPISSLGNSIRAIAGGDLGTRAHQQFGIHELNELSANINKMAEQLQENRSMLEHRIEEATLELREKIEEVEHAHLELRESEDRYRTLYTSTPVMLHSIDQNGVLVNVSDYWLSQMGYGRDEVIGKKSVVFLTEDSRHHATEEVLPAFMKTGVCQDVHYQFVRKDGSVMDTLLSATAEKDKEGRIIRSLAVVLDITERRQAQDALLSAKLQAEHANQAKSKFLAAVSHDLRQPIHAQGLFLEALSHTDLSAHQNKLLANARAASDASSEMLSTLLDFSRIEAGVIKPQLQPFRLQPMLNKVENELAPQADMKGLVYRTRETDLIVQSDPALVELILRNLVSNAIRYTRRGGLLVACRKHGDQVLLEVWDTGIGIAPEHQEDVFREFFQLENPERSVLKGMGLGLSIVRGLARTLGHELSLVSTPHRGSVFRLALPIATEILSVKQTEWAQNKTLLLKTRVLVIDDDKAVLAGMGHLLCEWGFECDTAESIEEALALARARAPSLVICDYRLREQHTGLDAIAALRELLGDAFPALLITGDTAPDLLREAQASGIPLLHKPVSPSQLYRTLMEVLEVFKRRVVLE